MRLIDADALIGKIHTQFFYESRDRTRVYSAIQEQPTIDAVPVVRCRECKYYFGDGCGECEMVSARLAAYQRDMRWNDEFYCAFGERKDGADNG